jgi:hypothetical protein
MQSVMRYIEKSLDSFLARYGRTIVRKSLLKAYELKSIEIVEQVEGALREIGVVHIPDRKGRQEQLAHLIGTSVSEGLYLCEHLYCTQEVKGDICEFGVAEGVTSALLASEIMKTARHLWLYDSFQGLPKPTQQDTLINDIFNLGSIERYEGTMRSPITAVQSRLAEVHFPPERYHIVKGFFDNSPTLPGPETIAFAYIDFDFYQPIRDALNFVKNRMPVGGRLVVDDYGWFSAGAQTAVDEFVADNKQNWQFELPYKFCGKFCILMKIA